MVEVEVVVTAQVADTVGVAVMAEVVAAAATTEVTVKMQVSYHAVFFCEYVIFSYSFFFTIHHPVPLTLHSITSKSASS